MKILLIHIITAASLLGRCTFSLAQEETRSKYALELSGIYNFTNLNMSDVNDEIGYQVRDFENTKQFYGAKAENVEKFNLTNMLDLKLGLRYWRMLGGLNFSTAYSTDGGFNTSHSVDYPNNQDITHYDIYGNYKMSLSTKEYLFYLGYLHPINKWLDVAILGSFGIGSAEAQMNKSRRKFRDNEPQYSSQSTHVLKDDYNPSRVEGHLRFNATKYVCVDLTVGYRISKPPNMRGDIKNIENGQEQTPQFDEPAEHHHDNASVTELLFDYSGMFYGIGITLKHPYEKK